MKEVKMYYWTKVDQGDTDEVYKVLNYAQLQFKGENEMFQIVNCTNSDGFTPLHLAASESHAPLIEILIKFGA
jgi:ankyrin repeat protein